MSKKYFKRRKAKNRPLDYQCLESGAYGVISSIQSDAKGHPVTAESFATQFRQCMTDIANSCPPDAPYIVVVECKSPITYRAIVPAIAQGALIATTESNQNSITFENSRMAEADEIARAAGAQARISIDVGNSLAADAEFGKLTLDQVGVRIASSPNEMIARKTYARARGPEARIDYPNGEQRLIGGGKIIPTAAQSSQTFTLRNCILTEVKPGKFRTEFGLKDESWQRLQAYSPGITLISGEHDSPVIQSLICAAAAAIPVDLEVSISEKVSNKQRSLEPLKILNKSDIFAQTREWLTMLEETLVQ